MGQNNAASVDHHIVGTDFPAVNADSAQRSSNPFQENYKELTNDGWQKRADHTQIADDKDEHRNCGKTGDHG